MTTATSSMPKVVYLNESKFREAMLGLRRRGSAHQRAYERACSLITGLSYGMEELNKMTNHGESRIKHCRKYDVSNDAHRLVTVHTDGYIYLLHVGTHEEVEKWLDRNRGLTITAHTKTNEIRVTHITKVETEGPRESAGINPAAYTDENIPYFKRIDFNVSEVVAQSFLVRQLESLNENSTDAEIEEIAVHIAQSDPIVGYLLLDVLLELRAGNKNAALARIDEYRGQAKDLTTDAELEVRAIESEANTDKALVLTGLSEDEIKKLFEPDRFQDWMLFPHPEQKRIAQKDFEKPTVLTGVSGSGKTCVLVHRAKHLATKYPGETILVLTLSRSLSRLIQSQLEALCGQTEYQNIRVMAFYDYFEQLVKRFGPQKYLEQLHMISMNHAEGGQVRKTINRVDQAKYAREFDPLSRESLDDTWEIFLDQRFVGILLGRLTERIRAYDENVDVAKYLREELTLVRSAVPTSSRREAYLELERHGRAIRFDEKTRHLILDLLLLYEETMLSGGLLDELSLTLTLLPHFTELNALPPELNFRCLLVDEFQDFSTRDLALLRRIASLKENSLFITGDTVQRILVKDLRLGAVGFDIINSSWERIKKNYRNSKQILKAASKLANHYGEEAKRQGMDIELLDPELAERETAKPLAIAVAENEEIMAAYQLARECLSGGSAKPWAICIATAAPDEIPVKRILESKPADFPVQVDSLTGDYTRNRDTMTVGSVADVKGFEFSMVIVVGCGEKLLPPTDGCPEEAWRHALRLYVAMTRGRDQVALTYAGRPSKFLEVMREDLEWQDRQPKAIE
jgi:superfamily I DNA/RNA helicase